jgi:hypothetical protein
MQFGSRWVLSLSVMLALSVVAAAVLQIPAHIMAVQICLILAAAYFVWTRPSA